jgi:hypothetical protein
MTAFEIHTYQGGRWKIDSVFDDRDLAMFEAQRMDESGRFSGLRVVEEVFNCDTNETRTRTIFRGSKVDTHNARAAEEQRQTRARAATARSQRDYKEAVKKKQKALRAKRKKSSPLKLVLILMLLLSLGLGGLIGLQLLHGIM